MSFADFRNYFKKATDTVDEGEVQALLDLFIQSRRDGRFVFVIGNGGSAANASHFCEDMAKGTVRDFDTQKRLKMLSLTDNTPQIMAWGNDEGFGRVFLEQLKTYANAGDVLVAISGSGNSENIITAVEWANANGLVTVGVTGYDGGKLRAMATHGLHVPINNMGTAEAVHDMVFHYFVETLCQKFGEEDGVQ